MALSNQERKSEMKKKVVILGIIGVIVVGIVVGCVVISSRKNSQMKQASSSTDMVKVETTLYQDPQLGFTFSYPTSLTLNPHEEDQENYTHAQFSKGQTDGGVIVWVKDTKYTTLEAWQKGDKELATSSAIDTTLASLPAKKIVTADKLYVAAIDNSLLYLVELDGKDPVLQSAFTTMVESFRFSSGVRISQIAAQPILLLEIL